MILPIYAYGQPVLKVKASDLDPLNYPDLDELISNMWETMYAAKGVGLAAPQIGHSLKLFIVDSTPYQEEGKEFKGLKQVFDNATCLEEAGDIWAFEEGCLSIPGIAADVERSTYVLLKAQDRHGKEFRLKAYDWLARILQHEIDHLHGVLMTDKAAKLYRLVKNKDGEVEAIPLEEKM